MSASSAHGAEPSTKGATVRGTLAYIQHTHGTTAVHEVLTAVMGVSGSSLAAVQSTDDVPYERLVALWNAAETRLQPVNPRWAEEAGAFNIESLGLQLYGGILRKPTPSDFLTQSVSLFRLFYAPGDMLVVHEETDYAVLRLVGFDARTPVFCRRQVGGLARALELAGGGSPTVRHVRCTLSGDAFCEWEMRWTARAERVDDQERT